MSAMLESLLTPEQRAECARNDRRVWYVVVVNAGQDNELVCGEYSTAAPAYAHLRRIARTDPRERVDVMKRLPDGSLTTEV